MLLFSLFTELSATQVYKKEVGDIVSYSDYPSEGDVAIKLPVVSVHQYLSIISPLNGGVLNGKKIVVKINKQKLEQNQYIAIFINNRQALLARQGKDFILREIEKGQHTIQVKVIDTNNNILRSSATIHIINR